MSELTSVALELPLMLIASWFVCRSIVRCLDVLQATGDHLTMGAFALGLLLCAEAALWVALGGTRRAFLAGLVTAAGAFGLARQLAFAAFPVAQR